MGPWNMGFESAFLGKLLVQRKVELWNLLSNNSQLKNQLVWYMGMNFKPFSKVFNFLKRKKWLLYQNSSTRILVQEPLLIKWDKLYYILLLLVHTYINCFWNPKWFFREMNFLSNCSSDQQQQKEIIKIKIKTDCEITVL